MVRRAGTGDLEEIVAIYNQAILAGFQTCFTEEFSVRDRELWFGNHSSERYPIFVFEDGKKVVGWISISPYREGRKALDGTVEISYFTERKFRGKGIGKKLVHEALKSCSRSGFRAVIAIVLEPNVASIKLLGKCGFEQWGFLPEVAHFGGVKCGQFYFGLLLD